MKSLLLTEKLLYAKCIIELNILWSINNNIKWSFNSTSSIKYLTVISTKLLSTLGYQALLILFQLILEYNALTITYFLKKKSNIVFHSNLKFLKMRNSITLQLFFQIPGIVKPQKYHTYTKKPNVILPNGQSKKTISILCLAPFDINIFQLLEKSA